MAVKRVLNQTRSNILAEECQMATSFVDRGVGLLGRSSLLPGHALWIARCNSIHTFFMKFPIDCIFVDKNFKVKAIYHDLKPWRLPLPVWGARSVFELSAGAAKSLGVQVGDQLNVVD